MPGVFSRDNFINDLEQNNEWDIVIIGGGATGLGIAVDAANRGFKTLLLEQSDFAKGTSSRSTKLVHGGVRYLAQGDIKLVYAALQERGILLQNAAHLVKKQAFVIPCYSVFSKLKYLVGLKLYDWLAGKYSFGPSKILHTKAVASRLGGINTKKLVGGVEYFDGQFDDARLAINLAQTAAEQGAVVINYMRVTDLDKEHNKINAVVAIDVETKRKYRLKTKAVINATGVFVDDILQMDKPGAKQLIRPSQGVHIVVDKKFLNSDSALMIPQTADGRVLFAVPWQQHLLVGTTDTPLEKHSLEPKALEKEIEFILSTLKQYLLNAPGKKDVLSVFAGLRPLAAPQGNTQNTKEISRDHKLMISDSGLVSITGGKWTTYRKMAEETVDAVIKNFDLPAVASQTKFIKIHGCVLPTNDHLSVYGSDAEKIKELIKETPSLDKKLVDGFEHTKAEVVWAVRKEMAQTIEDVLARRLRILFLDADAAKKAAPGVAEIMADELNWPKEKKQKQLNDFLALADQYWIATQTATGMQNKFQSTN